MTEETNTPERPVVEPWWIVWALLAAAWAVSLAWHVMLT